MSFLKKLLFVCGFTIGLMGLWGEGLSTPFDTYYYDLSLMGKAERQALNYHSLASNDWTVKDEGKALKVWGDQPLAEGFKVLDPALLFSFNSDYPSGMNDKAQWQGRGANLSLTGGAKAKWSVLSVTFAPQIWYAQNLAFDLAARDNSNLSPYSSFIPNIDWPQRFGDEALYKYDWGDSEIRLDYAGFTLGFGTQSVWLGPARRNALISSTNAAGVPKVDLGFRSFDNALGDFELFFWWGRLRESGYFDANSDNDHSLYSGLSISFRPRFIEGLTLGFHRTMISAWDSKAVKNYLYIIDPNFASSSFGADENDQRASVTFEWTFPSVGFTVYGEWARNDFSDLRRWITVPEHTQAFTLGLAKAVPLSGKDFLVFTAELSDLGNSRDYLINTMGNSRFGFYSHSILSHGYTNDGQIIGAGIGPGSDYQYFSVRYQNPRGYLGFYGERTAVVKDYVYGTVPNQLGDAFKLWTEFGFGIEYLLRFDSFAFFGECKKTYVLNRNFIPYNDGNNFYVQAGFRYVVK